MPLTTATTINHIPFAFDLMTLLPAAHLTELLFSLLVQVTSTLSCDWSSDPILRSDWSTTLTSVLSPVQDLAPSLLAASGEWPHHGPVCGDQDRPNEMMFEQVIMVMIMTIIMMMMMITMQ